MSIWKLHDQRWSGLAGTNASKTMHAFLIETFGKEYSKLSPSLRDTYPFVLVRDFGLAPWQRRFLNPEPEELYRFQFGPRSWSERILTHEHYTIPEEHPHYAQDAIRLAMSLKMAGWEKLAGQMIAPKPPIKLVSLSSPLEPDLRHLQVVLCWQADGRYLVIHDRKSATAIALTWDADSLHVMGEVSIRRLEALERTAFEAVVVPRDDELIEHKQGARAGQMDEMMEAIQWRYETKLDNKFDAILLEACDRMEEIEGELGIAYARHRFNDGCGDDNWLAVRCDNFAWENGNYFARDAQSLRSAPKDVHLLLGLLVHLEASGLSSAFNACYGYAPEDLDVIGVFRQEGRYYFACCSSNGDCGPVYSIDTKTGTTELFGFADRYDWNFNTRSRAGGAVPAQSVLEIVTIDEVIRRVRTGEIGYDGPPQGVDVPWHWYLPPAPTA